MISFKEVEHRKIFLLTVTLMKMGHYNDMRAILVSPHSTSVSLHYTPVSLNSTLVSFGNLRLAFLLGLGIFALHASLPYLACNTHLAALHICNTQ